MNEILGDFNTLDGAVADVVEACARQGSLDHPADVDALRARRIDTGSSST